MNRSSDIWDSDLREVGNLSIFSRSALGPRHNVLRALSDANWRFVITQKDGRPWGPAFWSHRVPAPEGRYSGILDWFGQRFILWARSNGSFARWHVRSPLHSVIITEHPRDQASVTQYLAVPESLMAGSLLRSETVGRVMELCHGEPARKRGLERVCLRCPLPPVPALYLGYDGPVTQPA